MTHTGKAKDPKYYLDCPNFTNRKVGGELLSGWMAGRLVQNREIAQWDDGDPRVTVLAYYFWADDPGLRRLDAIECAILETWRHCGRMKAVVVSDKPTSGLDALAARHGKWLEVQVEPSLVPGNLYTMSVDCNSRLYSRFSSEYVLIVQDDGFPLRSGLGEFIGKFDFIGAPYVRNKWYLQFVCRMFKCQVCNGGFSLRSRRVAELAAHYWEKKYYALPDCDAASEDYFCTKTLPLREPAYRRQVTLPTFSEANDFSYDAVFPYVGDRLPFGFHGALAFEAGGVV